MDLRFRENGCPKNWPERKRAQLRMWRNPAKQLFQYGGTAHLPQDVMRAIRFISKNGPDIIEAFWESRIERLKQNAFGCKRVTEEWGKSLSDEQKAAQGKINLPLLANMLNELGMGGQVWPYSLPRVFRL